MVPSPPPVLVVDDDQGIREALRDLLEDEGYTVFEAGNGNQALVFLAAHDEPCIVLLDRLMPMMDGVATLRAVAEDQTLARRHVYILFTVSTEQPLPEDIIELLQVPILEKPFRMERLLAVLVDATRRLGERQG
jgi:CheY-like chemotaxis protein